MNDIKDIKYFCPGSCGDVSVEPARDTGKLYYGPAVDDDQLSTTSETEQQRQDADTTGPRDQPEPGTFYSISEKCVESSGAEEEDDSAGEYYEVDDDDIDAQPNSSDVRTETGCRVFGTGSCVEVTGKIPDEWEIAAQRALEDEEDSEFPSVKYYTTPSCELVRPERQRSTGLRHFGGIDYRAVKYFCPAKKCDFMPPEPERDTGLTTFTGGAYDDAVYCVNPVPEIGNVDEIRVISGCHYYGSGLCTVESAKELRPGEGPEFVRYYCPGSCLDLEPETPRDTGVKYFGKPTGITSDDSIAVSEHVDEVDEFPLVRYFCTPSCDNVLAEWPRETGKKFFTAESTLPSAAVVEAGKPVRYFCALATDRVLVERERETGWREFGPPDETLLGYDYNLSDARTQSGCVYYSGEPCIDVVTADKSPKPPPPPEKYFCPGPCYHMPPETPRDTGQKYFGPTSSTSSLSDVDQSVSEEPDDTEHHAFNLMGARTKTSRWYFSGVPMYEGYPPVRYFCPGSCESLAAEPVRRTGSEYFGSEAVARLGPVSSRVAFGANSSDVRVETGCQYFGPGPCLEVVGWDRVPRCMTWTCYQVAGWIEQLGFTRYRDCFIDNYVTGRRLIHVNASTLPKLGITNIDHIKVIAKAVRNLLQIEQIPWNRSIRLPPREQLALFLERKSMKGIESDKLTIDKFADDWEYLKFEPPLCNHAMLLPRQ